MFLGLFMLRVIPPSEIMSYVGAALNIFEVSNTITKLQFKYN